jgi:plasmid stability protein
MPVLHVRNVPDSLYEQIKQQAQRSNRSISAQVITLLQRALTDGGPPQSEVLGSIRRRRFFNPHEINVPNSTTILLEDRAR